MRTAAAFFALLALAGCQGTVTNDELPVSELMRVVVGPTDSHSLTWVNSVATIMKDQDGPWKYHSVRGSYLLLQHRGDPRVMAIPLSRVVVDHIDPSLVKSRGPQTTEAGM